MPFKLTAQNGETWTPEGSSLKVQRLPNAPPPADTPAGRIRQMKSFAQKFTAHEFCSGSHNPIVRATNCV